MFLNPMNVRLDAMKKLDSLLKEPCVTTILQKVNMKMY